jgi:endonuclease/exonuclease/phosphatase family metal-dependent hydrolase
MPNRASLESLDVCARAAVRVVAIAVLSIVSAAAPGFAQVTTHGGTLKVGFYNIRAGKGVLALPGRTTPFVDNNNCTDSSQPMNAWGVGFVQRELVAKIGNDPAVIALGLGEAWADLCASPERVRATLGWKAKSTPNNGLAIVARHGFSGSVTVQQLDTSQSSNGEPRYVAHARVCVDAACSGTFDVFVTHMYASGSLRNTSMTTQVRQILAFMKQQAGTRPHTLLGDFNLYEEYGPACGQASWPSSILDNLRNAGYKDAWRSLKGSTPGYTGMTNRPGCGTPAGSTYKRIDYSWSLGVTPVAVGLFGVVPAGDPAPSDHYGILAEYALGAAPVPPPDVTAPVVSVRTPAEGAVVSGAAAVAADAADNVAVSRVEFLLDGAVAATDATGPFGMNWDTRLVSDGTHSLQARAYDSSGNHGLSALRMVTVKNGSVPPPPPPAGGWISAVNVSTAAGSLTKIDGCASCGDAGAVAEQQILASGGYVEFVPEAGVRLTAGLSADRSLSTDVSKLPYAFSFWTNGGWDIRESGVYRSEGRFAAGDKFRIAIENGGVVYYRNQVVVYRSRIAPALPLALDVTLFTSGGSITAAVTSSGAAPPPATTDVLLAAASARRFGAWQLVSDSGAATGALVRHPDAGAPKLGGALASPSSYFELTFEAKAGVAYRLWIRGRADRNHWSNDSVYAQFSGSVDAGGAPIWRIGTTSSTWLSLEQCGGCGVSGWGWQDNGYGAVGELGPLVRFAASGTQTIRIQTREDGFSIDQVVLSPERYRVTPPGANKNDSTVLVR